MKQKDYKPPAFPFYVKDWLTDDWILQASDTEIRVYIEMLSHSWLKNDTSLNYDVPYLARMCRCEEKIIEGLIKDKWKINDGKISNKKLRLIKEEMRAKHDLRVRAGQKGGKAKPKQCLNNAQAKRVAKEDEDADAKEIENNKENKVIIFYEKNIGLLNEYSCQVLTELEQEHGEDNVIKALKVAAEANARSLRYVKGVLDKEKGNDYSWEKQAKPKHYAI
jgi:DnaD/phage-associated family protein